MPKFPYRKLIHEAGFDFEVDDNNERESVIGKPIGWFRFNTLHLKKRFKLKIPWLRRLILRTKFRLVSAVQLSCAKVLKRLGESRAHFGDLFAGNYLFLQLNPTSTKRIKKSYQVADELNLYGLPSTYSLPGYAN